MISLGVINNDFIMNIDKQHCLSNLQAIIINTAVCILCQTQLFSEKRNAVTEIGNGRDRLVQSIFGHISLWWRGLMTGGLAVSRHLPPPFEETQYIRK